MKKLLKYFSLALLAIILLFAGYFFVGSVESAKEITWGVNFSQKQAEALGLDWQETYLALFDDLGVRNLKLITYWDLLEKDEGQYDFGDLDWQIEKANEYGVKALLVIGMKTPGWPECHIPEWAKGLGKEEQQAEILKLL